MPLVAAYHRPGSVAEALELLAEPQRVPLAGGTTLNADREPSSLEAVDLQALGLSEIRPLGDNRLRIGATATLDELRRCDLLPDSLREVARTEQPSTLRTLATVGGLVAKSSSESLLLAALLAHDCTVEIATLNGSTTTHQTSLQELLSNAFPPTALITSISINTSGLAATAKTGRTPADVPIVAVYGRRHEGTNTLVATGVGPTVTLLNPCNPTGGLAPVADFRGSRSYRLHLVATLAARVLVQLNQA